MDSGLRRNEREAWPRATDGKEPEHDLFAGRLSFMANQDFY